MVKALEKTNLPELSVVVLCYKAGEFIRQFVEKIRVLFNQERIFDYELILVGNYFPKDNDLTPLVVKKLADMYPNVRYVAKEKQGMMGWDMKSGLNLSRGRYISVIDGDGQMPVEDLAKVYRKIKAEKLDLVKTYRTVRGDSRWRKFLNIVYNLVFKILFYGLGAKDINSKPKIITREAYEKLNLESDNWFIDAEIMIQARRFNFKIGQIPTYFFGLSGRRESFVGFSAIMEFIKNLIVFRLKEFKKSKKI
ncbi:MAG: glycosyltransferase family 2 protein [Candidatus Falkowbacteria bacterium]